MTLPTGSFPTKQVKLTGGLVTVRGLSYAEGTQVRGDDAVYIMIALSLAMDLEAVREWTTRVPAGDVKLITETINDLSGFGEGAQKSE